MTLRDRLFFLGLYAGCFVMGAVVVAFAVGVNVGLGRLLGL